MLASIVYFGIGICFGLAIAYNRRDFRQQRTFEQIDEEVRSDLERYKNLSESLKDDVRFLKTRMSYIKQSSSTGEEGAAN